MARKKRSFLEGGSNVTLDNVGRLTGDRSKRYRKDNGEYDSDSNQEIDFLNM